MAHEHNMLFKTVNDRIALLLFVGKTKMRKTLFECQMASRDNNVKAFKENRAPFVLVNL